jgi:hypothetical protein
MHDITVREGWRARLGMGYELGRSDVCVDRLVRRQTRIVLRSWTRKLTTAAVLDSMQAVNAASQATPSYTAER